MLKILHVTDLHGHKPYYQWIHEQSENYDVICLTGDFVGSANHFSLQNNKNDQQIFVTKWLEKMTLPVFVCSGNHDVMTEVYNEQNFNLNDFDSNIDDADDYANPYSFDEELAEIERCTWLNSLSNKNIYADNAIHTIKRVTFGVIPYHYDGLLSRFIDCDILLHHEPPAKTATAIQEGEDFGNLKLYKALKDKLLSPDYVLSGHVHHPNSHSTKMYKTIIYNPGARFNSSIPNHKVLTL